MYCMPPKRHSGAGFAFWHAPHLFSTADSSDVARRYTTDRIHLSLLSSGLTLACLLAWIPPGRAVAEWCGKVALHHPVMAAVLFAALILAGRAVVGFPLACYGGFIHEHRFGLSTQRLGGWLADYAKALALGAAFSLAATAYFYWAVLSFGSGWMFVVLAGWLAVTVLLDVAFPVLILPLFIRLEPLNRPDLAERLGRLAAAAGFRLSGLFRAGFAAKTTKANAFLMGLGPTRKIALSDTLLNRYSPEEIEAVVAHELGHHVHKHMRVGLLLGLMAAFFVLDLMDVALVHWVLWPMGYRGLRDPSALPVILAFLALVEFLGRPVANVFSRGMEEQADRYALEATGNPAAYASLMEKLAAQNLTDPSPGPWIEAWFYSHPAPARRIAAAQAFAAARPPQTV
jgi:STE24 endopeptidase